jgi:hypothetical protein
MDIQEVKKKLCYYDKRNPNSNFEIEEIDNIKCEKGNCFCNNCFYDRTELAEYILELIENKNEK